MHGEEVAEYYTTTETLSSPDTKLDYFVGDISTARCYAFWVEKDYNNVDISYFQYCPYDLGKTVLGTEYGNHVSDWEHITIRFAKFAYNGVDYLKRIQVKYPSHNFAYDYTWAEVTKVDNTHPVAYSALGSHGMWKDNRELSHISLQSLKDVCGPRQEQNNKAAYTSAFISGGLYGWIEEWFMRGMQESPKEMAAMLEASTSPRIES